MAKRRYSTEQSHLFIADKLPNPPSSDGVNRVLTPDEINTLGKGTGPEWPATPKAIAGSAIKAFTLEEPTLSSTEIHPDSFGFRTLETKIIGFIFEEFSNGTLWLCAYDKQTGDEKTGRILDSMKVESKMVTAEQCKTLIKSVEILLSQREAA